MAVKMKAPPLTNASQRKRRLRSFNRL